ncbi:hypothetical protein AAVH_28112, partial [Aphelenchoides avenae]
DCCLVALFALLFAISTIVCISATFPPNCYDLPEKAQYLCPPIIKWSKGVGRALVGINL